MKKYFLLGIGIASLTGWQARAGLISDGGFETPEFVSVWPDNWHGVGYGILGSPWSFHDRSGITFLPSFWDDSSPYEGRQVAFIQDATQNSFFYQAFQVTSSGTYNLTFFDAGRKSWNGGVENGPELGGGNLTYMVQMDNNILSEFSTVSGQVFSGKSMLIDLSLGFHTLSFIGVSSTAIHNGDDTAFFDNVTLTAVPEPSTYLAGLSALGMLVLFGWRSRK